MAANIYRETGAHVKQVGSAVIKTNGQLQEAWLAKRAGSFLFSEVGAGTLPLVLLGTKPEIYAWLYEWQHTGIENQILELPNIYMTVQPYRPGARYEGLFPVQDAIMGITNSLVSLAGSAFGAGMDDHKGPETIGELVSGPGLNDLPGWYADGKGAQQFTSEWLKGVTYKSKLSDQAIKAAAGKIYVHFHYLQRPHSELIGSRYIAFWKIHALLKVTFNS